MVTRKSLNICIFLYGEIKKTESYSLWIANQLSIINFSDIAYSIILSGTQTMQTLVYEESQY